VECCSLNARSAMWAHRAMTGIVIGAASDCDFGLGVHHSCGRCYPRAPACPPGATCRRVDVDVGEQSPAVLLLTAGFLLMLACRLP
jgi:hypothetical protein